MKHSFKKLVIALSFCLLLAGSAFAQSTQNVQKENVIAQMNYCINSLTNIIHNKSMLVLEHESDQILNNLTMEQIIGLYEINDFRIDLLDAVSKFGITEQERNLLRRIQSIKRDNIKWAALSNALDATMLLSGNGGVGMRYQLAFQTLLTAARSTVEYQTMKDEQNIEELRAMWDLRKEDLKEINEKRKEALKIVFSLYDKYHLSEKDRLTEATANNFSTYISEVNAAKRARLLEDNRATYEHMADYYYHLGMAYLDLGNYDKARPNFNIYLNMYRKVPLLRYDEKSGCIALAMLANEKSLSDWEKKQYIDNALKNLPHNSAAILQCAMICLYELNEQEKALKLIRAGIEDPKASDRSLLYMAAANILPIATQFPKLNSEICSLFNEENRITLDSYITYLINSNKDIWREIPQLMTLTDVTYRRWYQLWIGKYFNDELHIILPENIIFDAGDISIYVEKHSSDKVTIKQLQTSFMNGVDIAEIEKVNCFKTNKDLKYLYFDVLVPDKSFIVKQDIDFAKIQKEEWHRQGEFDLTQDDIKDIIDLCKDKAPKNRLTELVCEYWDGDYVDKTNNELKIRFCGDELKYEAYHSNKQSGYYLRVVFANGISLMYKFEKDKLFPYMYIFNNKIVFAKEEYQQEYEYKGEKDPSWWKITWSRITNLFSNNDKNIDKEEIKKDSKDKEPSWWSKTCSFVADFFSGNDKDTEKKETVDKNSD